jgi:N-acetylmuramoyl-L-alanine amidase
MLKARKLKMAKEYKVYIGVGHGGSDPGAVANGFEEEDVNLSVANHCSAYLKARGVSVKQSRTKDVDSELIDRINEANLFGAVLALDIHHNAGGGDGAEIYHTKYFGKGHTLAVNILNEMLKIGQNSRGAKIKKNQYGNDYFGFVRQTNMPAVLVECAFLDNKKDVQIIDTEAERKIMGEAIARGVLKTLGVPDVIVSKKMKYQGTLPDLTKTTFGYLKKGYEGIQVRRLQLFLNWYGYKLDIDGDFGTKTEKAVKKFQKTQKLDVDGLFGKKSLARAKKVEK